MNLITCEDCSRSTYPIDGKCEQCREIAALKVSLRDAEVERDDLSAAIMGKGSTAILTVNILTWSSDQRLKFAAHLLGDCTLAHATTRAEEAEAERDHFKAELIDERAVCICGCDHSDHEFLGPDDGECCENEDHQCLRVAQGVRAMFIEQRERAEEAERKLKLAVELVDGAKPIVEIFGCVAPSQKVWRIKWLEKTRQLLTILEESNDD